MPVDLTKPHSDRRRVNRDAAAGVRQDGMYSREIEMKRNRGEISCAECRRCVRDRPKTLCVVPLVPLPCPSNILLSRPISLFSIPFFPARLKIKCDKQIPCQSCQVGPTHYMPISENSLSPRPQSGEDAPLCVRTVRVLFVLHPVS